MFFLQKKKEKYINFFSTTTKKSKKFCITKNQKLKTLRIQRRLQKKVVKEPFPIKTLFLRHPKNLLHHQLLKYHSQGRRKISRKVQERRFSHWKTKRRAKIDPINWTDCMSKICELLCRFFPKEMKKRSQGEIHLIKFN